MEITIHVVMAEGRHVYVCIQAGDHACIHVYTRVHTCTHVYTRIHTFPYIYIYIHIYIYIYMQNTSTVTEMTDVSIPHRHGGSSQCAAERLGMTSLAETSMLVPLSAQTCCNATKTIEIR